MFVSWRRRRQRRALWKKRRNGVVPALLLAVTFVAVVRLSMLPKESSIQESLPLLEPLNAISRQEESLRTRDFNSGVVLARKSGELSEAQHQSARESNTVLPAPARKKRQPKGTVRAKKKHTIVELQVDDMMSERRLQTDTGVNISDPALWHGVDLRGDSSTATVMGMATGYDLNVFQIFVGSLRKTGFRGHIILGVEANVSKEILDYLNDNRVITKLIHWTNCTFPKRRNPRFMNTRLCETHYPDIKPRWSRFPLLADWLAECETCTGPVLLTDVRDSYFQLDPFGLGSPIVKGLQVFEEDPSQRTTHWITSWPIGQCKHVKFDQPMLCSGTTVGTRIAMLKYLQIMHKEMKVWADSENCQFHMDGDDQSIHNYLFYSGQLPFATAIKNRSGGIVHTVGKVGAKMLKKHVENTMERYQLNETMAETIPYDGTNNVTWIDPRHNLTDSEGFFIERDGSRSRVIHQWDRFGPTLLSWLERKHANSVNVVSRKRSEA